MLLLIAVFIIFFNIFFGDNSSNEKNIHNTVEILTPHQKPADNIDDGEISCQGNTKGIEEEPSNKHPGKEIQTCKDSSYRAREQKSEIRPPESGLYSIKRGVKIVPKITTQITNSPSYSSYVKAEKVKLSGNFMIFMDKEGIIHLWDLEKKKEVFSVNACDSDNVKDFSISSSGDFLAVGCDKAVKVWNIRYGKLFIEKDLESLDSVAICGNNLLVASEGSVNLYEISEEELHRIGSIETGRISSIDCLTRREVAIYKGKTVAIWRILSEREAFQENILSGDITADTEKRRFSFIKSLRFEARRVLAIGAGKAVFLNEEGKVEIVDLKDKDEESFLPEIPCEAEIVDADFYRDKLVTVDKSLTVRIFSLGEEINEVESFSLLSSGKEETLTAQQETPRRFSRHWYKHQYALVVGINNYKRDPLNSAMADAEAIKKELERRGFEVRSLYNEGATKKNILKALEEIRKNMDNEDSFVFYFSGHGVSLKTPAGVERGFIIPYGAKVSSNSSIIKYEEETISLHDLKDIAYDMKAKHIAFFLDSCFSGLIFEKRGRKNIPRIETLLQKKAIDILTAGGNQEIYDGGPEHSPFTIALLEAFQGSADSNKDGFLTFPEIAKYVRKRVLELTANKNRQKPQFDNLVDTNEKGEFVFKVIKSTR